MLCVNTTLQLPYSPVNHDNDNTAVVHFDIHRALITVHKKSLALYLFL